MHPYDVIPCTPTFKDHGQVFKNWTPLIDTGMDLTTALTRFGASSHKVKQNDAPMQPPITWKRWSPRWSASAK